MSNQITLFQDDGVQKAVGILLYSLSENSQRQYQYTYTLWARFCEENNIDSFDMGAENIIAFLEASNLSRATKNSRLAHLRKLLETLHATFPTDANLQSMYLQAKLIKVKRTKEEKENTQTKTVLSRNQIFSAINVWSNGTKRHLRNKALIALLFYTGCRRSESAALRWDDINFTEGLMTIRSGKGDKERTIPILGEDALEYLLEWKSVCAGREYIFCSVNKGDNLGPDVPMVGKSVYFVVRQTATLIGKEFAPHDARRTIITTMLNDGTALHHAQRQAGHSSGSTTLKYAIVSDAKELKSKIKLSY